MKPAVSCAARARSWAGAQMIIGVDLEKDERVLYDAYNDAAGVTARFNLNVLVRINQELGGNFDLSAFTHRSIYNRERHRIEMHLISKKAQTVRIWATVLRSARAKASIPKAATSTASTASLPLRGAPAGPRPRHGRTRKYVLGSRAGGLGVTHGLSPPAGRGERVAICRCGSDRQNAARQSWAPAGAGRQACDGPSFPSQLLRPLDALLMWPPSNGGCGAYSIAS